MGTTNKLPDAWDDEDWITKTEEPQVKEPVPPPKKLTKAEKRAQQAEFNRQLWADAEAPTPAFYVDPKYETPLQSGFKPNVTLLARKPKPATESYRGLATGIDKLGLEDDDDEDGENKPEQLTAEQRLLKAQREREEKQKRYEEARKRLFGESSSGTTSPRTSFSPARNEKSRGRGRGNASWESPNSRPGSSASGRSRQLYNPNADTKSDLGASTKQISTTETSSESPIIRTPRGPDGSGRGGIGFVGRGNKAP